MAKYKGFIWGEWGDFETKAGALSSIRGTIRTHQKSAKQFPHHAASNTKYYYEVMPIGKKYKALYRYDNVI